MVVPVPVVWVDAREECQVVSELVTVTSSLLELLEAILLGSLGRLGRPSLWKFELVSGVKGQRRETVVVVWTAEVLERDLLSTIPS